MPCPPGLGPIPELELELPSIPIPEFEFELQGLELEGGIEMELKMPFWFSFFYHTFKVHSTYS